MWQSWWKLVKPANYFVKGELVRLLIMGVRFIDEVN